MTRELPVREVVASETMVIAPAEQADYNGHLNVRFHLDVLCDAIGEDLERRGFDARYRAAERCSLFTVEHSINYRTEIRIGDELCVSARLDGRVGKALYYTATLSNRTQGTTSSAMTAVLLHVDLATRRAVEFRPTVAAAIDATLVDL